MHLQRSLFPLVLFSILCGTSFAASSNDINWRGSGGWGVGLPYAMQFDPATLTQIAGEIVEVRKVVPLHGMTEGVAVILKHRNELLTVHLGPLWFLERQDALLLVPGDELEVRGARLQLDGRKGIVATEVTRKGRVLKLRDAQGLPVWSAWRQQ